MSEHLPECQRAYRDHLHRCICKYVLRCEQRMREGWYEVQSETWEQGFRYALDAARETVAAVEDQWDAEIDYDRDYAFDPSGGTRNPRIWLRDALAAIDALRGEP